PFSGRLRQPVEVRDRVGESQTIQGRSVLHRSQRDGVAWLLLIVPLCAMLSAHEFSQSESALVVDGRSVTARIDLNLLEFPDVDADRSGIVSYEELDRAIERVVAAVKEHFVLGAPEPPSAFVV